MYTIGILNFGFPDLNEQERYLREVQLVDTATQEVFYDKLTFLYIEMPKFRKTEDELISQFDNRTADAVDVCTEEPASFTGQTR